MGEEQITPYESYDLISDWKLIMQFNFALFTNKGEFVIIDNNDEYIARFSITNEWVIDVLVQLTKAPRHDCIAF